MSKKLKFITVVFMLVGLGSLIGSVSLFLSTRSFLKDAVLTHAQVIHLDSERDQNGNLMYYPVVSYQVLGDKTYQHRSSVGSSSSSYRVGESVKVYYQKSNPLNMKIDSFVNLWIGSLACLIFGLVFTLGSLLIRFKLCGKSHNAVLRLRKDGKKVVTTVKEVFQDTSITVNNRSPFRIITQLDDVSDHSVRTFKSERLWYDPSEWISDDQKVNVFVNFKKPKKYFMDLSFLPKQK